MAKGIKTGGRVKGTPNKVTASIKEAFLEAFERRGGVDALVDWAKGEPTEFYKLAARLIATELQGEVRLTHETATPELLRARLLEAGLDPDRVQETLLQ